MSNMGKFKKERTLIGKIIWFITIILLVVAILFVGIIGFLSITEFKPSQHESVEIISNSQKPLSVDSSLSIMTWNIGYGALGDNADFFMDGGKGVKTADKKRVLDNLGTIIEKIKNENPSIFFLQEIDIKSSRSCKINELEMMENSFKDYSFSFANNFKVSFLPYPIPPIGKVDSGIATASKFVVSSAERIQLPVPFSWPMSMANLKRCLLVSRLPIQGSEKELVLFNLHLEAYDDGNGKIAQTKMLSELLNFELEKGNYVVAGGDFNQIFSSININTYPIQEGKWALSKIDVAQIGDNWQYLMDETVPSCRSLDKPFLNADKEAFQYYLIDGFIVSDNIKVQSLNTLDCGFTASDHNPVLLKLKLD